MAQAGGMCLALGYCDEIWAVSLSSIALSDSCLPAPSLHLDMSLGGWSMICSNPPEYSIVSGNRSEHDKLLVDGVSCAVN